MYKRQFKYPCYFGTDIPDQKLLVATGRTVDQINEIIGADTLGYLSTEHVVRLAQNANGGFCTACFTGQYAVKPEEVLSTDIHERHLNDRPKDEMCIRDSPTGGPAGRRRPSSCWTG